MDGDGRQTSPPAGGLNPALPYVNVPRQRHAEKSQVNCGTIYAISFGGDYEGFLGAAVH